MAEYLFEQDQLDQMDNNIRDMLSKGATREDVMMYTNDYKEKFVKKKDGTTGLPSSPSVSVGIDPEELKARYARIGGGNKYINDLIDSKRSKDPAFAPRASEFISGANNLNEKNLKAERVNYVYDFLKKDSDIETNDQTRDAFLSSQYAGAYYSESPDLQKEYQQSDLKDILTPRQFTGLKSLSFGRQSDYLKSINKLKSADVDESEKEATKLELDKFGIDIDQDAAASMFNQNVNPQLVDTIYTRAKTDLPIVQEKLRQIDYENPYTARSFKNIINGAINRGVAMGSTADLLTVTSEQSGIDVERLAAIQRDLQAAKSSKAYEEFSKNPSLETFSRNPIGILTELSLESLAALYSHGSTRMATGGATGAAMGSVVPGIGTAVGLTSGITAGLGLSSLNLEYSSKILEGLNELGVDVTKPDQIKNAFSDEQLMSKLKSDGLKKGVPVALFDMLSAGLAGKIVSKPTKSVAGKLLQGTTEVGVQAGLGGAGEASGQLVSEGKISRPNDIIMEMVGEFGPGSVEIAYGSVVESAKKGSPVKTSDIVNIVTSDKKNIIDNNIKSEVVAGTITQEQADVINKEIAKVEASLPKVPEDLSADAKARTIELIDQKTKLTRQLKNLDDAFKPDITNKIKSIDEQIISIAQTDRNAITESQVQEGRTESNISQPQGAVQGQPEIGQGEGQQGQAEIPQADVSDSNISGKREVIKQKFDFVTDQDFVAEAFTPEEDAADRAALPESEFKSEEELSNFLANGEYAMLTGQNPDAVPLSKIANKKLNERATQWLADRGLKATPIFGKYDNSERSFLVPNMTKAQAIEFAKDFQQDSVAHSSGLVYKDGSFNPRTEGVNLEPRFDQGGDFFSSINIGGKPVDFSVNYDFETTVPAEGMQVDEQGQLIDTKLQDAVGKASQALQKSGIKFNIIDSSVNPEQADAARGNQAIFRDTDGTITIDKSKLANDIEAGIVVWHESSHPVMNIIRNTDRNLYDAVVRGLTSAAQRNEGIQKALNWATDGYEGNDVQADEALVETIARIAEGVVDISTLDTGLRQRIIDFINDIAKFFGINPIIDNTDLAEFKRVATQVAEALSQGRDIAEIVGEENVMEYGAPIGVPVQPKIADKYGPKVSHNGGNYKLSFVRPSDIIDIKSLIKEIADKDQKVWFWVADQLGRGMYYDSVIDGEHYLDAGPSFALDPKNRDKKVIWATGKGEKWVKDKIAKSDYIFIISGSPKNSKLFNKRVAEITFNRIKKVVGEEGSWDKFKSEVLGVSKIGKINEILNKYNSFEELLATPDRKELLIQFDEQKAKKGTPLKALLEKYGAFIDYNDLRDGFFKDNDFNMNDVMLVLKPTEYGGKSDHSTYENNILGEVVGVPDRRVDAFELMPDDFKAKYAPDMSKTGRSQAVAPYGSGIKNIQASVGLREDLVADAGLRKKMTEDGEGNYVFFHYSDKEFKKVDPSRFGSSNITGRDERPGVDIAMFYTDPDTSEFNANYGYSVRIPKDQVYTFDTDPLNLLPEARRAFEKQYPGQAFDANKQVGFVTKIAAENGFPMTVASWKLGGKKMLRAQTTEKLPVKKYSEIVPGTFNQVEYKEEFTANSKKRGQFSVGGRSEEELRAEGQGKERNRALASKYGDLSPETQAKIEDDAVTYFQRPNKQTEKAVEDFIEGINIMDAADYVLGNPDIPEVSKVWMAATVAKRLNAEIDAAKTDNNQDLVEALTSKQAEIYNEFAKKATSLGQAVQAFIAFKNDPNAVGFFLPKILRQLKKAGVEEVTEVQKADIINRLKNVNEAKPGLPKDKAIIELSHYLAGIAPMKPVDILQALWYAKILSGVTTQATNFFANVFNTLFELPAVGMRIAIKSGDPLAVIYGIKGFGSGVVKGAVSAADIIKTGVRSKEIDKYFSENPLEYFTWSKWLGEKGKVLDKIPPVNFGAWKYIGRILAATDALFSTANQEAVANMLAYADSDGKPSRNKFRQVDNLLNNTSEKALAAKKQAIREGFKRDSLQWKRRVIELIDQGRDAKVMEEADAIGKRITMNYDPEGWTKPVFDAVVGLQRNIPIIKMVVPFARIVANLTENALNYTPAGAVRAVIGKRSPFNKSGTPLTTNERIDLMSKFAIGMGALAILATKVGDDDDDWFDITAGGPNDTQKKYELQKGGWRPYTIVFKDGTRLNYKDWPIAGILAGMGNIRDSKKYGEADETSMALAAYGFFLNFYDKSLLSGLSDFFGIFNVNAGRGKYAPETKASERATKWAAQQAKSVAVSNLAQQTGKLYSELVTGDPQRDAKTFTEIIYRDLPMFNDGIRPIIDVFGDEVKYTITERLSPIMAEPEKDSLIKWLNENKLFVGVPKKTNIYDFDSDTERPMTDEEYYEYRKLAGKKTKEWILDFMADMKGDERQVTEAMFDAAKRAARSEAYAELFVK
jgi:hypothetical protein